LIQFQMFIDELHLGYDQPMTRTKLPVLLALTILWATGIVSAQQKTGKKAPPPAPKPVAAHVYLSPTCGCCGLWADHMKAAGFSVTREVTPDLDAVAPRKRVPEQLRSCHTAVIGKYLVEGHVPADVVRKLLREAPAVAGIAVPGMPIGSPGMEGPGAQPYAIVAFRANGTTYEFARK
jgi:hypothetical protein